VISWLVRSWHVSAVFEHVDGGIVRTAGRATRATVR
jgi:hypothetical protein